MVKNIISGYEFWKLVDKFNPYKTMRELAEHAGIEYNHVKQQRADCRMPKVDDLFSLSQTIGKSMEFLVTGGQKQIYPPRIEAIAAKCLAASSEDIRLVERILRLPHGDNEAAQLKNKA